MTTNCSRNVAATTFFLIAAVAFLQDLEMKQTFKKTIGFQWNLLPICTTTPAL